MKARFTLAALAAMSFTACSISPGMTQASGPMAMAKLEATRGNAVTGTVMFHQQGEQVMVHAKVEGLKPGQEHGFHIHEKGDCSSGDGMGTGGHFNPGAKPHGPHDSAERHAGDLPALKADAQGRADVKFQIGAVAVGWAFGLACALFGILRLLAQRRSLRRALRLAEQEVQALRSLPVPDAD